ncbi:MAG: SUF system NifU family Fe-S cluster assembly protein [Candidatus Marsarchaeota archaeon]|nr:SUF system NifU family Fe-S cluster assembly protein [Candidatus Marsarchaeota archaeon]
MPMDLYAEEIIAHYEHPHNRGKIDLPNLSTREYNPVCGDDITVYILLEKGRIIEIKFEGDGCAISMASASMVTDYVKGKTVKDVENMDAKTIIGLIGVDPGPARLKCAILPLKAIKNALKKLPPDTT